MARMDDEPTKPSAAAAVAYRKHGRDTPAGRRRYEASRRVPDNDAPRLMSSKPIETAEGDEYMLWRSRREAHQPARDGVYAVTARDGSGFNAVQRCDACWCWTTRLNLCDDCASAAASAAVNT